MSDNFEGVEGARPQAELSGVHTGSLVTVNRYEDNCVHIFLESYFQAV